MKKSLKMYLNNFKSLKYPYFKPVMCHWLLVKCSLDCEEKVFELTLMWETSTCLSPQLLE